MRINRLETHDRLEYFKKDQNSTIAQGAEDCLKRNPDSLALQEKSDYVYLYAHPRTADDGVNKRMLWQPRLKKPKAEPNSYLFRAKSKSDIIEICWILPPVELWAQYERGKVTESEIVSWSIQQFKFNKTSLESPDPKDLSDDQASIIWKQVINEIRQERDNNKILMPTTLVDSSSYQKLVF